MIVHDPSPISHVPFESIRNIWQFVKKNTNFLAEYNEKRSI
ncbi:hypothetical protein I656_00352 [Geobacillus sp. WSUCF1]|nr:hypothetical protein I656_00352 [Geobacillus sp. WSUCF1]